MEFLAPYHPVIVHTPIVLIIVALVFDLVGRAVDSDWWRKASLALLLIGVLGAWTAVLSGEAASEHAEHDQGIPEHVVDWHGDMAKLAAWLGLGALVTRVAAGGLGKARPVAAGLGLVLHLAAAVCVGIAAYRGGQLVYTHAAGVSLNGHLIKHPPESHGAAPAGP